MLNTHVHSLHKVPCLLHRSTLRLAPPHPLQKKTGVEGKARRGADRAAHAVDDAVDSVKHGWFGLKVKRALGSCSLLGPAWQTTLPLPFACGNHGLLIASRT
jgi:hypothetical protein